MPLPKKCPLCNANNDYQDVVTRHVFGNIVESCPNAADPLYKVYDIPNLRDFIGLLRIPGISIKNL